MTSQKMTTNQFLLAADNPSALLPLLRENPALAPAQDEHGYSLIHAAASYNLLDILRALVQEFNVDVNIKDEDHETALFVVETLDAAKLLVELGVDVNHRGSDGLTAQEKIAADGDFPEVAAYLSSVEATDQNGNTETPTANAVPEAAGSIPKGMSVTVGTMDESQEIPEIADPEFRRRIDELAQREDFNTPQGQAELRKLVEDALLGESFGAERSVRPRQD